MAVRYVATINAFNKGIENLSPAKAVNNIEDWEAALADTDVPGAKGIARDLAALRKALEKAEPDAQRVETLLHRLGAATTKIADRADRNGDKLKQLGEALSDAGTEEADEELDAKAAAAPKRRSTKK